MLKNYFKVAWRNLIRNKTFAFIKIIGLSIGLCVCMLILLYTKDELSFDQFHDNKNQLYRVTQSMQIGANAPQNMFITQGTPGVAFKQEIPGVLEYIRITGDARTVRRGDEVFNENPLFADSNFFSLFNFPLLKGDPNTALKDVHAVVLTEDYAKKYFGSTDAIGKTLQIKQADEFVSYTVTGIAENTPQNSTIRFDMLMPLLNPSEGWVGGSLNTFLLLSPQANVAAIEQKMNALLYKNTKEKIEQVKREEGLIVKQSMNLQPFTDIHLNTKLGPGNGLTNGSNPMYSYALTCIAIFILLIACINFINLAIAQSLRRSKEIGIRKVIGGTRKQLIRQFLTESLLVSFIAFVIAFALTYAVLPWFNELANKKLSLSYLTDYTLYIGWFLLLVVTSFIAGFYPSLVLSGFQPVKVLYSKQRLMGRNYLTKGLIVLQFALAIFLIIGTFVINKQLNFLLHTNMGYDSHNLVQINLPRSKTSNQLPELFKNELAGNSSIISIAARNGGRTTSGVHADAKQVIIDYNKIDYNFFPTFKIPVIAGRNFSPDYPSDSTNSVIVNESFVQEAGWKVNETPGKSITFMERENPKVTIVGVIRNYHYASLREKIQPQVFAMDPGENYGQLWVKVHPAHIPQALALLKTTHARLVPFFPYDGVFLDERIAYNYKTETKWQQIISIASGLFIFISCIGLLGLVMLSIEQRNKEIGIRKVLGAALARIVLLIAKDFIRLIAIACVITIPVAYYFTRNWLQDFAYRANIGWWVYALPGILVIALALLTLSFHTIKAALANPVKSLRSE